MAGDGALTARCEDGRVNPDSPDQVRTLMEVAESLAREAGALVAQEAGAQVTGLRGRAAQESMTVAGLPGRVEELRAFLEALDADSDG